MKRQQPTGMDRLRTLLIVLLVTTAIPIMSGCRKESITIPEDMEDGEWVNMDLITIGTEAVLASAFSGSSVYALGRTMENGQWTVRLHRSIDGGNNWHSTFLHQGLWQQFQYRSLWFANDSVGFLSHGDGTMEGIQRFRTSDAGATWSPVNTSGTWYAGVVGSTQLYDFSRHTTTGWSMDLGETWSPSPAPSHIETMDLCDAWNGVAVVATGMYITNDGGLTWEPRCTGTFHDVSHWDGQCGVAAQPEAPGSTHMRLCYTSDGWETFSLLPIPEELRTSVTGSLIILADRPGTLYAGRGSQLFSSEDRGIHWHREHVFESEFMVDIRDIMRFEDLVVITTSGSRWAYKHVPL